MEKREQLNEQRTQRRWEIYKELVIYQIKDIRRSDFGWAQIENKDEILECLYETAQRAEEVFERMNNQPTKEEGK